MRLKQHIGIMKPQCLIHQCCCSKFICWLFSDIHCVLCAVQVLVRCWAPTNGSRKEYVLQSPPMVFRMPTTPQYEAGLRSEPPKSVPVASHTCSSQPQSLYIACTACSKTLTSEIHVGPRSRNFKAAAESMRKVSHTCSSRQQPHQQDVCDTQQALHKPLELTPTRSPCCVSHFALLLLLWSRLLPAQLLSTDPERTCPTATAAAEPPDDPPGVLLVSQGLRVVPNSSL